MALEYPNDPESYRMVAGFWSFDRQVYEGLGCDFSALEDPSAEAVVPTLRRRSAIIMEARKSRSVSQAQVTRAEEALRRARSDCYNAGSRVLGPLRQALKKEVTIKHPAIQEFLTERAEANGDNVGRYVHLVPSEVGMRLSMVQIEFVRPVNPDIFPGDTGITHAFRDIFPPNCGGSSSAYDAVLTADQLVHARAAATFGL